MTTVAELAVKLKDKDEEVRQKAVLALGKIGGPEAIVILKEVALKDEAYWVRWETAWVLAKIQKGAT